MLPTGKVPNKSHRISGLPETVRFSAAYHAWVLNLDTCTAVWEKTKSNPTPQGQVDCEVSMAAHLNQRNLQKVDL